MPNHVRNVLTFSKLTAEDKDFILNNFTAKTRKDDIFPLDRIFDFNKIIPEPETKEDCPADCIVNKDSHVQLTPGKEWFNWYEWHNKYWGTKWNAYDEYIQVGKSTITFVFSTAWSAPFPIYEKLADEYDFKFTVKYADEAIGSNCGKISYDPTAGYSEQYDSDISNPTDFARRLWRNY